MGGMERRRWGPEETPHEKFQRVAEYRMEQAVQHIKLLEPLASDPGCEWTARDALMMVAALQTTVAGVAKVFAGGKGATNG